MEQGTENPIQSLDTPFRPRPEYSSNNDENISRPLAVPTLFLDNDKEDDQETDMDRDEIDARKAQIGGGRSFPPTLSGEPEQYLVDFEGKDDPAHPQNWPMSKKVLITAIVSGTCFVTTFASGIYSPAVPIIAKKYGVGNEVATLGVTLYVLGFSFGPVLWGPLSEVKGRRLPLVVAAFGVTIFHFATAVSKDLQSILVNRFFAGFFGTSPLAVGGGVFVDMFDNKTRGFAVMAFCLTVFIGPMCAPFIGGFIVTSDLSWRWTMYLSGILASAMAVLSFLLLDESYAPIILAQKASALRRTTKNWAIHAKIEETEFNLKELVEKNLTRPLHMLFVEPIVLLMSLYAAFIYGMLYLFLTAFPKIFQGVYGMSPGIAGLPELGAVLGCAITAIAVIFLQPSYVRKLEANKNMPIPEWRMPEAMYGAVLFAGGLFWMGWSGYRKDVHWIVPTIGGVVTGHGISFVFLQTFNYLIDSYLMFAASALAANTFLRSLFGAIFPLFASYMFDNLGIEWAMTLLGCLAALLAPVPIVFYFKGASIRQVSRYTPKIPLQNPVASKKEDV